MDRTRLYAKHSTPRAILASVAFPRLREPFFTLKSDVVYANWVSTRRRLCDEFSKYREEIRRLAAYLQRNVTSEVQFRKILQI